MEQSCIALAGLGIFLPSTPGPDGPGKGCFGPPGLMQARPRQNKHKVGVQRLRAKHGAVSCDSLTALVKKANAIGTP